MKKYKIINNFERALGDLRRGFFIYLPKKNEILTSPENIGENEFKKIKELSGKISLIISANRLNKEIDKKTLGYIKIDAKKLSLKKIQDLSGFNIKKNINSGKFKIRPAKGYDKILNIFKFAELLPAAIAIETTGKIKKFIKKNGVISIKPEDINLYYKNINFTLRKVSSAPLALKNAENCEIHAFRPLNGGKEHYAIIVGKPEKIPLIRIHSSCYTGDLLSSLRCDCRDQLHEAIAYMSKNGGGIVLYLMQEGRGIGLVNKLRAYDLQQTYGLDTVEANTHLGFDDDERPFFPASTILKLMKINEIKLLTNNPRKAEELEKLGIAVNECIPVITKTNTHNIEYLKTKSEKMRHLL